MNRDAKLQRLRALTRLSELNKQKHSLAVNEAYKAKEEANNLVRKKMDQIDAAIQRRALHSGENTVIDPTVIDVESVYFDRIKSELADMQQTLRERESGYAHTLSELGKSQAKKQVYEKKTDALENILEQIAEKKAAWDNYRETASEGDLVK